jgi:type I restriction enzyme, S subunit
MVERNCGDFFDLVTGYAFKSADFVDTGIPVIKIKNVKAGEFSEHEFSYVSESFLHEHREKLASYDDLLISMSGNRHDGSPATWVGKIALFRKPGNYFINQRVGALRLRTGARLDARFAAYVLSSFPYQELFIAIATSSGGQANLSPKQIMDAPMRYPNLDTQRAIAHILGMLDDKIELNRRMSETVEAMARALFKSWFVDFDPVRAKARGRAPSLPKPLADLFPARLVESELREIPEGWEVKPLPEVIEVNPARTLRKGDVAPYLDMANMPTREHSPDAVVDRPFGSGMRFMNGDTLVARITPCLENGKTAFVDFLTDGHVGWGSTEYIVLRPKPPLPAEFAYCLARSESFRDFAIQSMTGSSGRQRVPAESLSHFHLAVASPPIAEMFGRMITPLFARASRAANESRMLANLRDALLPKLISGELRTRVECRREAQDR